MTENIISRNTGSTSPPHILIVDDEPEVIRALQRQFRRQYTVHTASTIAEALEILEQWPIQVVISDQRMPTTTGVEFFSQIKNTYPETMRILLTGYADVNAIIAAINDGSIFRYIKKPWDRAELQNVVQAAHEQHELLAENRRLIGDLRRSEQRYRDLFQDSPLVLWELDLTGIQPCVEKNLEHASQTLAECLKHVELSSYNHTTLNLLEASDEDELTDHIQNLAHTDMLVFFEGFFRALTKGERTYQHDATLHTLRGNQADVLIRGSLLAGINDGESRAVVAIMDIGEQKQAQVALQSMLARELELSKLRSRVIETVSHEFRTPLAIIRTTVEVLTRYLDRLSPEKRAEKTKQIDDAITRMTHLLDNAMAYSESEVGALQINPAVFNLGILCRNIARQFQSAKQRTLSIDVNHNGDCARVSLDQHVVTSMIEHMLYSVMNSFPDDTPAHVALHLNCAESAVTLTLTSEGEYTPQPKSAAMLSALNPLSDPKAHPGIGLNLAIVRHLVTLHNGTLQLENHQEQGMQMVVTLPTK